MGAHAHVDVDRRGPKRAPVAPELASRLGCQTPRRGARDLTRVPSAPQCAVYELLSPEALPSVGQREATQHPDTHSAHTQNSHGRRSTRDPGSSPGAGKENKQDAVNGAPRNGKTLELIRRRVASLSSVSARGLGNPAPKEEPLWEPGLQQGEKQLRLIGGGAAAGR